MRADLADSMEVESNLLTSDSDDKDRSPPLATHAYIQHLVADNNAVSNDNDVLFGLASLRQRRDGQWPPPHHHPACG